MLGLNVIAIIVELLIWIYLFLKFSKDMSYYKSMLFADFVVTTIDFVLLFTPLRTTIVEFYIFNKRTGAIICTIPLTFGVVLLIKSALFYLGQEFFPEWMRQRKPSQEVEGVMGYDEERERRLLGTTYR